MIWRKCKNHGNFLVESDAYPLSNMETSLLHVVFSTCFYFLTYVLQSRYSNHYLLIARTWRVFFSRIQNLEGFWNVWRTTTCKDVLLCIKALLSLECALAQQLDKFLFLLRDVWSIKLASQLTARPSEEEKSNHDTGGALEHSYIQVHTGGKYLVVATSFENWNPVG